MKMRRLVIIFTMMIISAVSLYGQDHHQFDPVETKIYFRLGKSNIDLSYKGNGDALNYFLEELRQLASDPNYSVKSITVSGSSSPEGTSTFNQQLSDRRTEALYKWVTSHFPEYRHIIKKNSIGVDWDQLYTLVENSYVPYKSRVLDFIANTPIWIRREGKIVDGRVKQLKDLDEGRVWRYMYNNFFSDMRMAGGGIVCEVECIKEEEELSSIVIDSHRSLVVVNGDTTSYSSRDMVSVIPQDTIHLVYKDTIRITDDSAKFQEVIENAVKDKKKEKKPFYMSFKTNLLYDALLVPTIGAEIHLGKGWTIGGNWMYSWWDMANEHYYHRVAGGDLSVRKHFGKKYKQNPLAGHHVGIYGQILTYDLEYGDKGQMADKWSFGGGVEYGYSFPIARRLNLDLTLGLGYFTGQYENYIPEDGHYVWQSTYMRKWMGPTKAEVSLVWLIGKKNFNKK
jgi:hypothetical protein